MLQTQSCKAAQIQQPPAEEVVPAPTPKNPTQRMAYRLRMAHMRERALRASRIEGIAKHCTGDPSQIEPGWYKLARELMLLDCEHPERFIHVQHSFSMQTSDGLAQGPIFTLLQSKQAWVQYEIYNARVEWALEQQLGADVRTLRREFYRADIMYPNRTRQERWEYVFMNKMTDISPLFQYCIVWSEGMYDLAALHYDAAMRQLLTDPHGYSKVWATAIPQPLKEEAAKIILTPL